MKKIFIYLFITLFIYLFITSDLQAGSYTANGLYKPDVNEVGWGDLMNDNTDILEKYLDTINIPTLADDAIHIDASGQVGINDTTPSYRLDVNGTFHAVGAQTFDAKGTWTNGDIELTTGRLGVGMTPVWKIDTLTTNALGFRMVSPTSLIIRYDGDGNVIFQQRTFHASETNQFLGSRSRGTMASPVEVNADDVLYSIRGAGNDTFGSANFIVGAQIDFVANENFRSGPVDGGTRIEFRNAPDGSQTLDLNLVLANDGALELQKDNQPVSFGAAQENRIYTDAAANENLVLDTNNGAGEVSINDNYYFPNADGTVNELLVTDGLKNVDWKTATSHTQLSFSMYDAEPSRSSETSLDGAFLSLITGQPLNPTPTDIVVSKGTGKIIVVVNAGGDLVGDITVTGTSVDRDTGATTGADTDTLTVDALTTDNSDTDTNGNTRHAFTGAYVTSKWFVNTVTLSTTNLTLTDVDVYHVSFEQFDDTANIILDTFDANILTTNVAAEFDAYFYSIEVTGDKCDITREASLNVGADGETALANKYWRLRRGNISKAIDGTTDGTWVDVHYSNSPAYVEDVSIKVWATEIVPLTLN